MLAVAEWGQQGIKDGGWQVRAHSGPCGKR